MKILSFVLVLLVISCKNERPLNVMSQDNNELVKLTDSVGVSLQSTGLEVYDYEGLTPFLSTSSDKTYVINFWATWCAPCVKELPYFEEMTKNYSDKNVEVILVSLDFPKKYDSSLKPFIKGHRLERYRFEYLDSKN
jgi:thiol-disulfide isomerase/thioredoxin